MPTPLIRAVLFDLDHTLFDTDRAERLALRAALATLRLRLTPSTLQAYRSINEELWERYRQGLINPSTLSYERFRLLLDHLGVDPRGAHTLARLYLRCLSSRGDLLPHCRRVLAWIEKRRALGVVSNGIDRVQRARLQIGGLDRFFATVVTSEACGFTKPDPRILEVALRELRVSPSEALYVGDDARADARAALGAGVRFCWLDRGLPLPLGVRRPRVRITALPELKALLEGTRL